MRFANAILLVILSGAVGHAQWTQWSGPNRDGVVPAASVAASWPSSPTLTWRQVVGERYSSPVADGPFLYGFGSTRKGQLTCLDARTGTSKWATEGGADTNAAIQSAGPHLVVLTTDGELLIVNRNPEKYEELRRYKVANSETWAHSVVLAIELVIRDADSVAVWSLKPPPA